MHAVCLHCSADRTIAGLDTQNWVSVQDWAERMHSDECLKRVAQTMAASVQRPQDFPARFGDEEFVIVLQETDAASA